MRVVVEEVNAEENEVDADRVGQALHRCPNLPQRQQMIERDDFLEALRKNLHCNGLVEHEERDEAIRDEESESPA